MNRTELTAFFEKAQHAAAPCKITFYSSAGKCSFFVRTLDANGKPIQRRHAVTGALLMKKGKPIYEEQREEFSPIVSTRSSRADALCFKTVLSDELGTFTAYDKEMIAVLEEMADDESSRIRRESKYKQDKNPEAFAREQEMEKLKKEHGAKVAQAKEEGKLEASTAYEKKLAEMAKALKEAEKTISDLTEPDQKPHKPGK